MLLIFHFFSISHRVSHFGLLDSINNCCKTNCIFLYQFLEVEFVLVCVKNSFAVIATNKCYWLPRFTHPWGDPSINTKMKCQALIRMPKHINWPEWHSFGIKKKWDSSSIIYLVVVFRVRPSSTQPVKIAKKNVVIAKDPTVFSKFLKSRQQMVRMKSIYLTRSRR